MTPERWRRVEALFNEAVGLPAAERDAWLERATGDADVLGEVRSLLASDSDPHGGLARPVHEVILSLDSHRGGRRVGSYQLLRQIGRGGMGAVYLAVRDGDFQQRVAVKLVRTGMDSEEVLARFRRERQLLAFLSHPNIALLLDGGATEEGQPFFVMEYVDGVPITKYCEERHLSLDERLSLFLQVCAAVQHAHASLIVHRDLKPGNILVTREGIPKLLDFGIAKLLLPDLGAHSPAQTSTAMRIFTPEYASPEQVRGETVTTSADVYSLGAILFELLTGHRPYDLDHLSPSEIERVICHVEVQKPSAAASSRGAPARVSRQLAGDLDNIVLMATRKEPSRRYQSVEQLADDIRHVQRGLPVRARPDTFRYRANKFVGRHRLAVAAGAVMALSLLGGTGAALYQAQRAERRFQELRHLANTFLFDFHDQIENLPGSTPARELVVRTALQYLDSLASESSGDASLQLELATAYQRVGDVQGHVLTSNLGNTTGALESYRKGLALVEPLSGDANLPVARLVISLLHKTADVLSYRGDVAESVAALERARDFGAALIARNVSDPSIRGEIAAIYTMLGISQSRQGDVADGLKNTRLAVKMWEEVVERQPEDLEAKARLASAYANLGGALLRTNDPRAALESYRRGLVITKALHDLDPLNTGRRRALMLAYSHVADTLGSPTAPSLGDFEGALEHYEPMLALAQAVADADDRDKRARSDLAIALMRVGSTRSFAGEAQAGLADLRRSAAIMEQLLPEDPDDLRLQSNLMFTYGRIGDALRDNDNRAAAIQEYMKAVSLGERLVAQSPDDAEPVRVLVSVYARAAPELAAAGDRRRSIESAHRARTLAEAWGARNPAASRARIAVAVSYGTLGTVYARLAEPRHSASAADDRREAQTWHERSSTEWNRLPAGGALGPLDVILRDRTTRALLSPGGSE